MNDQHEQNLNSPSVAVRWQAQMEDHLSDVRALTTEAMLPGIDPDQASFRAALANAAATAALALALANGLGDLETAVAATS